MLFPMTEWFYARGGQQNGPVTLEQLRDLAQSGGLDPAKDLVWNATMKDWTPSGQVAGIFSSAAAVMPAPVSQQPPADPSNPYAAPQSAWVEPVHTSAFAEIIPGSDPLDAVACVKRGFDLTKRKFGEILLVGVVYFALLMGLSLVMGIVQGIVGATGQSGGFQPSSNGATPVPSGAAMIVVVISQIVNQLFSMFLGLGLTRVGLNFVSGKPVEVGMLFTQGDKLLRVIGASIIFFFAAGIGLILLIVPGVYIMLRYGQYMTAIVDRNMGIMESFSYSSTLTTNNRLNIFVLWLLSIPVIIAGMLACGVGLIFAGPVVWLAFMAAYRWMQYGHQAVTDHPGTSTPTLSNL
jgi:uncharacterized membrane protein